VTAAVRRFFSHPQKKFTKSENNPLHLFKSMV